MTSSHPDSSIAPDSSAADFQRLLAGYAELLVKVGVNLQPGGKLLVNAPLEAAELARLVARSAYRAGALNVVVRYVDEQLARLKMDAAPDAAIEYVPAWLPDEALRMIEDGYSFLTLDGSDPDLMAGADPERLAKTATLRAAVMRPVSQKMMGFEAAWCIGAISIPSWAIKVYPELAPEEAVSALWRDIFKVTRADTPDPVAAWQAHIVRLGKVRDFLNTQHFASLHFADPHGETDLTVGLADGHLWAGVEDHTKAGVKIVPNMPTDEVFTAPHRDRVDGVAVASKPLLVRGETVEGIRVRFEGGKVVEASARSGEATFLKLLDTDEGARHIGEVALVAASAPVAQTGRLFYNTLFDENAASHIALGRAYPFTFSQDPAQSGGNDSLIHEDWMIGTPSMNVDGVNPDGSRVTLMRGGEWAIEGLTT
ncbi:aminopeptidase [Deinococcus psychrotolerans]|uniref:Aminopeptidase n=1 Tax=Deinococcus psychrotolerans TaxID=2489213 RepID=A0A3G8YKR7_9DEIO|nr:aminopeptidase [Deinococcus psychrotolerans]AZI43164.1 aminopeptidase [Deinococcus psychrotolerans]